MKALKNIDIADIARTIKTCRIENALTQDGLSKISWISKMTISRIERKTNNPSIDTIMKLLHAMYHESFSGVVLLFDNLPWENWFE